MTLAAGPPRRAPAPPSLDALRWAEAAAGQGACVVRMQRLVGGISSVVHALTLQDPRGQTHRVALRRWVWQPAGITGPRVEREAAILSALGATDLPVPRLLAADPSGKASGGHPALLMTHLPGHVHLAPRDADDWLRQMARVLVRIHAARVQAPAFNPRFAQREFVVPDWAQEPAVWQQAIDLAHGPRPAFAPTFVHADFQHFNVLWLRERLSGVVDWEQAAIGPAEVDVGHCCLNLAVLFSPDWAERFRLAYEAEAGRAMDPWWLAMALLRYLPGWDSFIQVQAGRRATLDRAGMHGRVEDFLKTTLRRL